MAHFRGFLPEILLALLSAVVLLPKSEVAGATASSHLGERCNTNAICVDTNVSCKDGTCECNDGYVNSTNLCLKVVDIWQGSCSVTEQCKEFKEAVCKDNTCQCMPSHHFLDGQCWTSRHLKEECRTDNECYLELHANRIECSHGMCNCKDGFEINYTGDDCNGGNKLWNLGVISLLLIQLLKHLIN